MAFLPPRYARGLACRGRLAMDPSAHWEAHWEEIRVPNVTTLDLESLDFAKGGGLVSVVVQDATTGAVLMTAFADREALERTIETGEMHFRSRSRGLWHKGATSGNTQRVVSLERDCDGDAVLARVVPAGPACHTGTASCFPTTSASSDTLAELDATIASRLSLGDASSATGRVSYTQRLGDD